MVKNLPSMQETCVQSLGWEDPLEKEMTTHSSILAWKIPWTEETGGLQTKGSKRVGHDCDIHFQTLHLCCVMDTTSPAAVPSSAPSSADLHVTGDKSTAVETY